MTVRSVLACYLAFAAASATAGIGIAAAFCVATLTGIGGAPLVHPERMPDLLFVAGLASGAGALIYPYALVSALAGGHDLFSPWGLLGGMTLAPTLVLAAVSLLWLALRRWLLWLPRLGIAVALAATAGVPIFLTVEGG